MIIIYEFAYRRRGESKPFNYLNISYTHFTNRRYTHSIYGERGDNLSRELRVDETHDLWTYLAATTKPLIIYGMGNGADKIASALAACGKQADDYFASDGFVRGHTFRGKRVLCFDDIRRKYKDFIILLSFATSLPSVLSDIYALDGEYELYAPDVPVYGDGLFTMSYYREHYEEMNSAYKLLDGEEARAEYRDVINYKLSGRIKYLRNSHFDIAKSIITCYNYSVYVDGGAYNGDTVLDMCRCCPSLRRIYAFEPDGRSFARLLRTTADIKPRLAAYNGALYSTAGECCLAEKANRNTSLAQNVSEEIRNFGAKQRMTRMYTLDGVVGDDRCDFIKLDVEGSEREALLGAAKTIKRCSPDIQISLYHRNRDVYSLILLAAELSNKKRFTVRKSVYVPAWDFNLFITE